MILLDGLTLSQKILSDLKLKIDNSKLKINLDIILVGSDPSSLKYVSLKQAKAEQISIGGRLHHLPSDISESDLLLLISSLNSAPEVTGFFIQLPLPLHLDKNLILDSISPQKDIDGLTSNSPFLPAVVRGILTLINNYQIALSGKSVVIINDSDLIGQPLKKEFEKLGAEVSLCNRSTTDLKSMTLKSDILISATGAKNIITADMVKDGVVAIDIGGGDIDFIAVSQKASFITPTFGGVGPMTVASLLQNVSDLTAKK